MNALVDTAVLATAGEMLVRVTVLLLLAHAVLFVMRRSSAAARELAARWFLVALCVLPGIVASDLSIGVLPQWGDGIVAADVGLTRPIEGLGAGDPNPSTAMTATVATSQVGVWELVASIALLVWVAGSMAWLGYALIGHVMASRRLLGAAATPLPDKLRQRLGIEGRRSAWLSAAAAQPMVVGLWRPRIVLPEDFVTWSESRQRAVLAHEHAHVERRDGLTLVVWQLARALWWPHPLVWSLGRHMALAREQACDDRALEADIPATDYAADLVGLAQTLRSSHRSPVVAMTTTTTSQLEARVHAVLEPGAQRSRPTGVRRLVPMGLALLFGVVCAAGDAVAQERPASKPTKQERGQPKNKTVGDQNEVLLVLAKRTVLYGGRVIGVGGVKPLVARLSKKGKLPVRILAGPKEPAALLVKVIDEAKKGGAQRVSIATTGKLPGLPGPTATLEDPKSPPLDRKPRAIYQPSPKLTPVLRKLNGKVAVSFAVTAEGLVTAPKIRQSTDHRFDPAVLEAIKRWQFEPAVRKGKPVTVRMKLPFYFRPPIAPPKLPEQSEPLDLRALEKQLDELREKVRKEGPKVVPAKKAGAKKVGAAKEVGMIRGVVLDDDSEASLAGAEVKILETGQRALTSKHGLYVFAKVSAGKYTLVVTKKGYRRQVKAGVKVAAGQLVNVKVSVTAR